MGFQSMVLLRQWVRWMVVAGVILVTPAYAAYSVIEWDWTQGSGAAIDGFKVKCGRTSGSYSVTTTIADNSIRSYDIYTVVGGRGQWFCTVVSYTSTNESAPATETIFVLPVPPMILSPQP